MTKYTIDSSPADWSYYEGALLAGRAEVGSSVTAADEVELFNGGVMTVDFDSLSGAALGSGTPFPRPLTRMILQDGTASIDSTEVRHIAVSTTASPPSFGDTVTFSGGESGKFMRFHTIDGVDYMKLRNLTGPVFSAETITSGGYSAAASGDSHIGTMEVALTNAQWYGDYSAASGKVAIAGDWYYLRDSSGDVWESDGSNSQTVEHYSEDYVAAIFVETGDGTDVWEIYYNMSASGVFTDFVAGPAQRCFYKADSDNTITFGSAVNGNKVPPSGARIRVPNLHFGVPNPGLTDWIYGNAEATSIGMFGTNTHMVCDKAEFGSVKIFPYGDLVSIGVTNSLTDCTFGSGMDTYGSFSLVNRTMRVNVVFTRCGVDSHFSAGDTDAKEFIKIQTVTGSLAFEFHDCFFMQSERSQHALAWNTNTPCPNTYIKIRNSVFGANNNSASGGNPTAFNLEAPGAVYDIDGLVTYGDGPNVVSAAEGSTFKNMTAYSHTNDVQANQSNHNGYSFVACPDLLLDNLNFGDNYKVNASPLTLRNNSKIRIGNLGGGDWDSPATWFGNAYTSPQHLHTIYGMQNVFAHGWSIRRNDPAYSTSSFLLLYGTKNCLFVNCLFQDNEAVDGWTGLDPIDADGLRFKSCRLGCGSLGLYGPQGNSDTFGRVDGSYYFCIEVSDFFHSDTVGSIAFTSGEGPHIDYSNAPSVLKFGTGAFYIVEEGEYVEWESHLILGHTGFSTTPIYGYWSLNGDAIGDEFNSYDWEYDLDTGGGYSGSWTSLDMDGTAESNLVGESVDPSAGFKIKVRATRNSVDLSNPQPIMSFWINTTTTRAAQRDNLHPIAIVPVQVSFIDIDTLLGIESVVVLLKAGAGGPLPVNATVSITRSGSIATVSHATHGLKTGLKVEISGAVESEYNGLKTITKIDNNSYSFPVSGTPTTPATGTIKCTGIVATGVTNSSGLFLDSDVEYLGSDQPVVGWGRKGTTEPFYEQSDIVGIMTSEGFTSTQLMVRD